MDSLIAILRDENADVNVIATSSEEIPESNILLDYMDGVGDISINSNGDVKEKTKKTKKSKTDKRDRSGTFLSGKKQRRTTIIKKWGAENGKNPGTLQHVAETLASQTGVQVKMMLYDPITKRCREFKTSNFLASNFERRPEVPHDIMPMTSVPQPQQPQPQQLQQLQQLQQPSPYFHPTAYHSPSKMLNLPTPLMIPPACPPHHL